MGVPLPAWKDRVRVILGEPPVKDISDQAVIDNVKTAIQRFSGDRPQIAYDDFTGDSVTFDIPLPDAWVPRFSSPKAIEYPLGQRPATILDLEEVVLLPTDDQPATIRLNETTPAAGTIARIFFTVPWPIPDSDADTDLIALEDFEPVCHLAAYYCALGRASGAAGNTRPSIPSADVAGEATETDRWRSVARDQLKIYTDHVAGSDFGPADTIIDWDAPATLPVYPGFGKGYLFRPPRR
ncbi:MAG: hypothetical protein ACJ76P_04910 [Actinomycetota bacterium]